MFSALLTAAFLAGLALVAYGCWRVYEPAGFIAAGLMLALVPVAYMRGSRRV